MAKPLHLGLLNSGLILNASESSPAGNITMAQKLDDSEVVTFKELLLANSIQTDALAQLLIEKGFITQT